MSRTRFIGANWKMNPPPAGAFDVASPFRSSGKPEVVVFPSFLDLRACAGKLKLGAQYGRPETTGAFTGDVSLQMAKDAGASYVLCGHSERRRYHEENDAFIAAQVKAAIDVGLIAVLCIGESADEQELKTTDDVLKRQLSAVLKECSAILTPKNFIVAYEPVWAIGSGRTAAPTDAQAVHSFIRKLLPSADIRIIYGGSVNGKNAKDFFSQPDIDGALVGGCSLKPDEFRAIVEAA
ncbi:MAG: triose-phosphate isomerase [Candidatus Peribacteraceae bacterium]|nr:triose-phosphate isomerase [Candidatus Peribacteraceae bacterium]MBP9850492.1 triose-phosphate isomerase [Candidatus Peribacteraceae bacterium]